jgi:hypothetical protein
MPDLDEATTVQLFEELVKRHVAVLLAFETEEGVPRVMWQGRLTSCLGMAMIAKRLVLDELNFDDADETAEGN